MKLQEYCLCAFFIAVFFLYHSHDYQFNHAVLLYSSYYILLHYLEVIQWLYEFGSSSSFMTRIKKFAHEPNVIVLINMLTHLFLNLDANVGYNILNKTVVWLEYSLNQYHESFN